MKNLVAVLWILVVIFFYFANHGYYITGWNEVLAWTPYILLLPAIYFGYIYLKGENKINITFPKIIVGALLLIMITGNFAYIIRDPSIYHGPDLFYSNEQVVAIENSSQITGNELIIIKNEGSLENTKEALAERIPSEYHEYFERPKFLDIQIGLFTKTVAILGIMLLLTLTATSFGFTTLKRLLGKNTPLSSDNTLISIGIGLFGIALGAFILGAFNSLTTLSTWILFGALLLISWKSLFHILKSLFKFKYRYEGKTLNFNLLILLVIVLVGSANFIDNIFPIPRGWDGLNQYMNITQRLSEAEGLIQIGGNYFWEILMSLGLIMFQWDTASMIIASLFPSILCLIGLYLVLKKFISTRGALISSAVIYITPLFTFHSVEENKIDLGMFAISIIAFLSLFLSFKSESKKEKTVYLIIAGLLFGFCLGIKITGLMLILAAITILLYKAYKAKGAIAGILMGLGLLLISGHIAPGAETNISTTAFQTTGLIFLAITIGILIMSVLKDKGIKGLKPVITLSLCAILAFSPWLIKNYTESHTLSVNGLFFGEHPGPTLDLDRSLCAEDTGTYEELDRYLGYNKFPINFMVMPWTSTMNDVSGYTDFGWIFLALLPGLIIFLPRKKMSKNFKLITLFGVSYWIFWLVSSNGIIWYGLPGFLALGAWTGGLIDNYEKREEAGKHFINVVILIFLTSSLVLRLGSAGTPISLLYASGLMTAEAATNDIFPSAQHIHDIFEADQDGENDLIWKIGTQLNYFIEDNFWRTYNDQYMDDINCLYAERDPELLSERLKELGFGYIIFDYNSYLLSPDPKGTLKEKYDSISTYLIENTEIISLDYYYFKHIVVQIP